MSERRASVSETGCGIFLTAAELRSLGVDPESTESVDYAVTEGGIVLAESAGVSDE